MGAVVQLSLLAHALTAAACACAPADGSAQVAEKEAALDDMREVRICDLPEPMSSKAVRREVRQ